MTPIFLAFADRLISSSQTEIVRDGECQYMEHYFKQRSNSIFDRNNDETADEVFNEFIDDVRVEIEAWSQKGSGWVIDRIMSAYVNVPRYEPFRRGSYMPLQKNCKTRKQSSTYKTETTNAMFEMVASCCFIPAASRRKSDKGLKLPHRRLPEFHRNRFSHTSFTNRQT